MEQIKLARSKASNLLVPDDYDGSTYHAKLSRELAAVSRPGRSVDSTRPLQYTTFSVGAFLLKVFKEKPAIHWCFTTHRLLSLRESVIHVTSRESPATTFVFRRQQPALRVVSAINPTVEKRHHQGLR